MKIIAKDNFCREEISDRLICENINEYYGEKILEFLKGTFESAYSDDYFELVDDEYKLYDANLY